MLIRAFEFELAVPVEEIGTNVTVLRKPFLLNDRKAGNQMPLLLKPYVRVDWLDLSYTSRVWFAVGWFDAGPCGIRWKKRLVYQEYD